MTKRYLTQNQDASGQLLPPYYTQNPIPVYSTFEVPYQGRILVFRLEQHYVSDETVSVIKILEEKT